MKASDLGLNKKLYDKEGAIHTISWCLYLCEHVTMIIESHKVCFRVIPPRDTEYISYLAKLFNDMDFDNDLFMSEISSKWYDDPIAYSDCVNFMSPGNNTLQILF